MVNSLEDKLKETNIVALGIARNSLLSREISLLKSNKINNLVDSCIDYFNMYFENPNNLFLFSLASTFESQLKGNLGKEVDDSFDKMDYKGIIEVSENGIALSDSSKINKVNEFFGNIKNTDIEEAYISLAQYLENAESDGVGLRESYIKDIQKCMDIITEERESGDKDEIFKHARNDLRGHMERSYLNPETLKMEKFAKSPVFKWAAKQLEISPEDS